MIVIDELNLALTDLLEAFAKINLPFHITGGLTSALYGEPRLTQDIDLVIKFNVSDSVKKFLESFSEKFILDPVLVEKEIKRQGIFQALHDETMIKVDFHVGEAVHGELTRTVVTEILPKIIVPVVSREDAILSKLIWIKKGSHKSRQDLRMMLKMATSINREWLLEQAEIYDVRDLLLEVESEG